MLSRNPYIWAGLGLLVVGSLVCLSAYLIFGLIWLTALGISMLIIVKGDMFAHKLVAVLERKKIAHRDVYDIWYFLKNRWPINKEIVEKRTGINFKDYLKKCIAFVESLSDRNILSGMGELLDEKQKAWAKIHLRKETVFLLKIRLEQQK